MSQVGGQIEKGKEFCPKVILSCLGLDHLLIRDALDSEVPVVETIYHSSEILDLDNSVKNWKRGFPGLKVYFRDVENK
jgi:hypothetical protein